MIALRGLHASLRPYAESLVDEARKAGLAVEVTSVFRSLAQQARLRSNYESCLRLGVFPSSTSLASGLSCAYPANRPGDSGHNYGLAWDSWVPQEQMTDWIEWRREQGWTVPDNDPIHAEYPNWRQYVQAR
jgi:type II secretory pathway pseudopilin PulG